MKNFSWPRLGKFIALGMLSLFLTLVVLGGLVFTYFAITSPTLSEEELIATASSKIYDNQNNLIADLGSEKRENASPEEIPVELVNAIVAIEDHRFFDHRGLDSVRIAGAALNNLTSSSRQGGSTLTQQLIKLTYFSTATSDQTLSRKAREAWLAMQLEQRATKQEILTYYINKVYMSNGNYGMKTAAQSYYGKELKDLSLPQLALLAGMPQAPNQYDPYSNPEAALERRNLVLGEMKEMNYITAEQYEQAINTQITDGLQSLRRTESYPAYLDNYLKQVIEQVEQETGNNLLTTGMEVYTNVDIEAQQQLWNIYNTYDYVAYPDDEMQVASTIVDVSNGRVVAQLGGRNQSNNVSFGTNQAVETNRDFGSSMKPITDYAPAIENGIYDSTGAYVYDTPYDYPGSNTPIYDYDRRFLGTITLQYAIQDSRNVPAVRALEAVGLDESLKFLNGLGINYPEMLYANAISSNTTISDRQYGASSEKMAAAYAAFANGGTYYRPQYVNRVVYQDGTSQDLTDKGNRAMSEQTAYMITDMLKTVLTHNTGRNAAIAGLFQAGKTGTSNYGDDEVAKLTRSTAGSYIATPDELFVGYSPQYAMAVWTGYNNRFTPILDDGINVATSVYRNMMTYLHPNGNDDFPMPSGLYRSGSYVFKNGANTSNAARGVRQVPSYNRVDDDEEDYIVPSPSSTSSSNSVTSSSSDETTPTSSNMLDNVFPNPNTLPSSNVENDMPNSNRNQTGSE
ncbi:penicillin-binding protein PBP1A [Streptococcus danieliae]|uniref:PBP1A family penicillin-binding protein n=1 Tax=Streptococcus danieliae TaxID=747656 RepID=A0A7X3G860_9STRE|nr:penicillin-binding protein PBP1A [Streptococcus danieliae]MCU0082782.1 penicillin-binding protein PBP1A [Streptococcus danieliae]MVX58903.1 PBP1A family penicillin-binding protein [Streptococcus danieliae]